MEEDSKKIILVPEFTITNGLITPTLKLEKRFIKAKYKAQIDALYPSRNGGTGLFCQLMVQHL